MDEVFLKISQWLDTASLAMETLTVRAPRMVGTAAGSADGLIKVGITTDGISGGRTTDGMTIGSLTVMAALALTRSLWMYLAFAVEPVSCLSFHSAGNGGPSRSQRV